MDYEYKDFLELEKGYYNFFEPAFKVTIGGTDLVKKLGIAVGGVSVNLSKNALSSCSFDLNNIYDLKKSDFAIDNLLSNYLIPGKEVEISMGYRDKLTPMFAGFITSTGFEFPGGDAPKINVNGMDLLHIMTKGKGTYSWQDKKYSEVVSEVLEKGGKFQSSNIHVSVTGEKKKYIVKNKMSNYQFLSEIAKRLHCEIFTDGKEVYFREAPKSGKSVTTLAWGKSLKSFSVTLDIADQVPGVIVRAFDAEKQKEIEGKSDSIDKIGKNSKTGIDIVKELMSSEEHKVNVYSADITTKEEADKEAKALENEIARKFITGSAESIGLPDIKPGRFITLDGLGKRLNSIYYIVSAKHSVNSSGYITTFEVEGNAI